MSRQQQHRAERDQWLSSADIYHLVFAEVVAWQESHWALQRDEGDFAEQVAYGAQGVLGLTADDITRTRPPGDQRTLYDQVKSGVTCAERRQAITRAVQDHMDRVSATGPVS